MTIRDIRFREENCSTFFFLFPNYRYRMQSHTFTTQYALHPSEKLTAIFNTRSSTKFRESSAKSDFLRHPEQLLL